MANGRVARRLFAEQRGPAAVDGMPSRMGRIKSLFPRSTTRRTASRLATAGRKQDGRKATFGIKAKLFLAFGAMAMLTAVASAVAWYSFTEIDRSERRINEEGIVGMAASLRLAEKSAEITAMAPAVIASRNEEEQIQEHVKLVQRLNELSALTEGLKATAVAEVEIRQSDRDRRQDRNRAQCAGRSCRAAPAIKRAKGNRGRRSCGLARQAPRRSGAFGGRCRLRPRDHQRGGDGQEQGSDQGLVEGGVNVLQALLTLRADGNLAAGLLVEAAYVDDPALMPPIREQFSAAAAAIERNLKALPQSVRNERLREASEALIALGGGADNVFETRLRELRTAGGTQGALPVNRERMAAAVEVAHGAMLDALAPMVDDAGFDLVTTSEKVTADNTKAIKDLVEGGVNTLQALLTLRAESNLAVGLLNEAVSIPDPSSIKPLQERFVGAANRMSKLLAQVPGAVDGVALKDLAKKLIASGASEQNVFDLRRRELHEVALAQASLEANNSLVLRLGKEVAELVKTARNNSDAAAQSAAQAISNGQILLLLITALSALGAALIALRYVVPQVVRPIENITAAMTGLAAGDTSIEVPGRDRTDEIGRMAEALGVFRDTAIEVQRSNETEIRAGRQRLAVAIESISEAFSLYDSEDRLVICNSKYRTILYPDGGAEISPGMTFESIIRQRRRAREHQGRRGPG